jgi:hypothetical protein
MCRAPAYKFEALSSNPSAIKKTGGTSMRTTEYSKQKNEIGFLFYTMHKLQLKLK